MKFISWFKGSLEDQFGVASFRRIYNWILICLVAFVVIYVTLHSATMNMFFIYLIAILLVAGFLNTSVITADNVLRFFNRGKASDNAPIINDQKLPPIPDPTKNVIKL